MTFTKKEAIQYLKSGLESAIQAVNAREEGISLLKYESVGRRVLSQLIDKKSLINKVFPIPEEIRELANETIESFPDPRSLESLLTLSKKYSRLRA